VLRKKKEKNFNVETVCAKGGSANKNPKRLEVRVCEGVFCLSTIFPSRRAHRIAEVGEGVGVVGLIKGRIEMPHREKVKLGR